MGTGEEGGGPKAGSGLHGPEHYISSGREWIWSAVCNHVGNILLKPQVLERRKGGETASDGLSASIADKVFTASQDEGLREGWGGWVKAATGRESQYLKVSGHQGTPILVVSRGLFSRMLVLTILKRQTRNDARVCRLESEYNHP